MALCESEDMTTALAKALGNGLDSDESAEAIWRKVSPVRVEEEEESPVAPGWLAPVEVTTVPMTPAGVEPSVPALVAVAASSFFRRRSVSRSGLKISEMAESLVDLVEQASSGDILVVCGIALRVDEAWGMGGAILELTDRKGGGSIPVFIPLHLTKQFDLSQLGEFVKLRGKVRQGKRKGLFGLAWLNPDNFSTATPA